MQLYTRHPDRAGFADPEWLVEISVCLVLGVLILPFARRDDWIGLACAVASPILILPFVLLIIVGGCQRLRDALHPEDVSARPRDTDDKSG